jgi:TnpA family transposase
LDAFKLDGPAPHRLSKDERLELAVAVLIGDGLNLGLKEISRSIGHGSKLGRLRNFAANYFTSKNLKESSAKMIATWDRLGLGLSWGPGRSCSVDGRVVRSNFKNLFSSYHHRKGKIGVTIYWVVRDDYLASSIRIIGNQDWESWYVLDNLQQPTGDKPLDISTGDTHGQHLAAWGLAYLIGKQLTVRFRQLGNVKIYGPRRGRWCGIDGVKAIDWNLIRRAIPSLNRLALAVRNGDVVPSEIIRILNLYDEGGINVMDALRELGKIPRTEFILEYAMNPSFRKRIHNNCQRSETWNSFQDAVFFGNGGRVATNNPRRRDEIGLAMQLIMNSIVFYNAWRWGPKLKKAGATPVVWGHVRFLGRYKLMKRHSPSTKSR